MSDEDEEEEVVRWPGQWNTDGGWEGAKPPEAYDGVGAAEPAEKAYEEADAEEVEKQNR
eukprot:COSAG01_NODE_46128_length_402_cov_103.881188_1_plen_58_part_01